MSSHKVVLIPGDGIGPEITVAVTRILEAAGADIEWVHRKAGESALETEGEVLPQNTIDAIAELGIALKGPCTTPVGKGFKSVNVQLRKAFDLYAAVRPVRNLEGVKHATPVSI
jgi:isocitrate dehydrogenase (NAD+)